MRILDKYILREYIKIFLIIVFAFSVLFLVIDVSDRLPRLLRKDAQMNDLIIYFLLRIPYLIILTSPVMVLLSGLFLMDSLSKFNESIAIRAAGISIFRMVTPLIWYGFIFSIVVMILGETVLPKAEEYRQFVYTEKIKNMKVEDKKLRSNIHYLGSDNNLYYIGFFDGYRNLLRTIDITTYEPGTGMVKKKITAADAKWKDDKWHFKNCNIRYYSQGVLDSLQFFNSTVIKEVDVTPVDFIKSAKKPMSMNFFELRNYIGRLKKVGEKFTKEMTELNLKVSFPFANLIILLFSVPLVSTSSRSRSRGLVFGMGLLVCFLYLSALRICQSLGYNGVLSPLMAAWFPNLIFAIIGIYFVIKAEV
ncbi:MAG: LptF/LptG family permease [Candidatus Cloacimonetes bacterium]|nr:LptF/LptG family permease [Candidatus Cloacimonadota bacterium]MCF7868675.1 LptF/LptG family permease [Candidatus Cloacimonadota bacterium]